MKQAFEMFATGKYRIMDIRDFLAENGIITRGSKKCPIDQVTRHILTNPFYYGHFRFLGEIHEGIQEPIITKKLFEAVQLVLNKRSKPWSKPRVPKPFLGLFRCGECDMMITAELQKGHTYYRCSKKSKTIKCIQPYTRQEELDSQLSDMIISVSLRQNWASKMLEKLEEEKVDLAQSCGVFAQSKRDEIKEKTIRLQRLLDSYLDQDIDRDSYLNKKSELLSQKKTLEEQIFRFEQTHHAWLEPVSFR